MSSSRREVAYTGTFVAVASLLCAGVAVDPFTDDAEYKELVDTGPFFPEFEEYKQAASLEVLKVDRKNGLIRVFKVERDASGLWVMPSKYNYPADARERMGELAEKIIGMKRSVMRSTRVEDQASMWVVDPKDLDKPLKGKGTRVTVRDASGSVLADFVISPSQKELEKEHEKDEKTKKDDDEDDDEEQKELQAMNLPEGHRFVRVVDEDRIYSTAVDLDLSIKFTDWMETDLLKLGSVSDITSIVVDRSRINQRARQANEIIIPDPNSSVIAKNDDGDWIVKGMDEGSVASVATIESLTGTLKELKISDVVHEQLLEAQQNPLMKVFPQAGYILIKRDDLQAQGGPGRGWYSNEGELRIDMEEGITFVLRFGNVVEGSEKKTEDEKTGDHEGHDHADEDAGPKRFLRVNVELNQALIAARFQETKRDKGKDDAAKEKKNTIQRFENLEARFKGWCYIISAGKYNTLRPAHDALYEPDPKLAPFPPVKKGDEQEGPLPGFDPEGPEAPEKDPGEKDPEDSKTGEKDPEDSKTGEKDPEDSKTGENDPEDEKTVEKKKPDEKKPEKKKKKKKKRP